MPLQGSPSYDDRLLIRKSILTEVGLNPDDTNRIMLEHNKISRIYYNRKFFDYPMTMKPQTSKNMEFICTVKATFSHLKVVVREQEENPLEDFYIDHFGKVLYSIFFESYPEKLWANTPAKSQHIRVRSG